MREDNALRVYYADRFVGTLAMTADYKVAFQYSDEWLECMKVGQCMLIITT